METPAASAISAIDTIDTPYGALTGRGYITSITDNVSGALKAMTALHKLPVPWHVAFRALDKIGKTAPKRPNRLRMRRGSRRDTLHMLANGKVDAAPLVTGTVGLAGVADAFETLRQPDHHAKIVIDPRKVEPAH